MLELHRSELVTPTGRVPLEVGREEHSSSFRVNRGQLLFAEHEDLAVRVGVLPKYQTLLIDSMRIAHEIAAVDGESFYQLNGGARRPIDLRLTGNSQQPRRQHFRFEYELTPPPSLHEAAVPGGTIVPASMERIEAGEDDVHALHLSFVVDGEPYAVDLEFEVEIETRRVLAAPATP